MFEPSRFTTHVGRLFREACSLPPRGMQYAGRLDGSGGGYATPMRPSQNGGRPSGPMLHFHGRYPTGPLRTVSPRSASPKNISSSWLFGRPPHVSACPEAARQKCAGASQ